MAKSKVIEQVTGELILYIPLVLLAAISGMTWAVLSSMTVFFICKFQYNPKESFHFDEGIKGDISCFALSYGTFVSIGLLTLGLGVVTPYMQNQPMIPVILSIGLTWVWAIMGDIKYNYNSAKQENEDFRREKEQIKAFRFEKYCDEDKALEVCRYYNMTNRETNLLIQKYVKDTSDVKLQRMFSAANIRREIRQIKTKYDLL